MKLKKLFFRFLLIPGLSAMLFSAGEEGSKEVAVEGMADIRKAGIAEAYDRALSDAQRNAVAEALGTIVDQRTMVAEAQLISEEIYAKTQGYIEKYEITEKWDKDGVAFVKIKALVGLAKLKENVMALDVLMKKMSMPRLIIFISETINNKNEGTTKTNDVLTAKFIDKQFQIITKNDTDPSLATDEEKLYKLMDAGRKDDFVALAAKLGDAYNAEIAIIGKMNASKVESTMLGNMKSFQSNISVQVLNINDGRIIATSSKNGRGIQIAEQPAALKAFENAAQIAADDLLNQILKAWEDILNNGNVLTLYVKGMDFTEEIKFTKDLKDTFREVKDVFSKKKTGDLSQFTVKFTGNAKDMATALVSAPKFSYEVDVQKYGLGSVTIAAKKK